jgi:Ca2+-transporting ATPase
MTARSIYTLAYPSISFGLTGVGYDPSTGSLMRSTESENIVASNELSRQGEQKVTKSSMEFGAIQALFGVACICNNANISQGDDKDAKTTHSGQPTELALLVGAAKSKVPDSRAQYHRLQEIPFTSDRKRMEVKARPLNSEHSCAAFKQAIRRKRNPSDESLYFVKGMPESVLGECKSHIAADGSAIEFTDVGRRRVLSQSRRMAASGLRVLAMAYGPSLDDLIFAGVVGMEDPPRECVAEAVRDLHKSGISVLMVTGDSKETALAIGKRCGIIGSRQCTIEMQDDTDILNMHPPSHNPFDDLEFGAGLGKCIQARNQIPLLWLLILLISMISKQH